MKIVIFAGGTGRRLWPISRQMTPKQFEPIVGEQSTLQMAVARVEKMVGLENIFVSTNEQYLGIVRRQLPQVPASNLIGEPVRRDLAAAVGLAMVHLHRVAGSDEPVAILWGDNTMQDPATFCQLLADSAQLIRSGRARITFIGETPRFPNENLGWIGLRGQLGEIAGRPYYGFEALTYRPPLAQCKVMFAGGNHVWNTGYFVTTAAFVRQATKEHQPALWAGLQQIEAALGTAHYQQTLGRVYPSLPSLSFDEAVLMHLDPADALVLHGEMGWSDPGTLYALKEAITRAGESNATQGLVQAPDTADSLLYNYEPGKLLVGIGLEGMIVVNTEDAILVVHKDNVPLVKQFVDRLIGTELERYS